MKKIIIVPLITLILIIGIIFLYLVLAVNDDKKWFKEFNKQGIDSTRVSDSSHYLKNTDSIKGSH